MRRSRRLSEVVRPQALTGAVVNATKSKVSRCIVSFFRRAVLLLAALLSFAGCAQFAVVVIEDEVPELERDRSADVRAYCGRGLVSAFKGDLDGAITDFTAAIEISLGRAASYLYRGNAYAIMGDHHRAIADYDRAIGIDPGPG